MNSVRIGEARFPGLPTKESGVKVAIQPKAKANWQSSLNSEADWPGINDKGISDFGCRLAKHCRVVHRCIVRLVSEDAELWQDWRISGTEFFRIESEVMSDIPSHTEGINNEIVATLPLPDDFFKPRSLGDLARIGKIGDKKFKYWRTWLTGVNKDVKWPTCKMDEPLARDRGVRPAYPDTTLWHR
ncbi:MAG: hypothetical protein R2688_03990 [Fimbriimonadaceae bacterium]